MGVTIPTVHRNGTSGQELMDGYVTALDALRLAFQALAASAPNGRDYPQDSEAVKKATEEHWERMAQIGGVMAEIEAIAIGVSDQDFGFRNNLRIAENNS